MVSKERKLMTLQPFSAGGDIEKELFTHPTPTDVENGIRLLLNALLRGVHISIKMTCCPVVGLYLTHLGNKVRAHFHGVRAAGTEPTAARRIHWARHVTLEYYPLLLGIGVRNGYRREQGLSIRVERVCVELDRKS